MSRWDGATVLLTGGTGWFGQHFTAYALEHLNVRSIRIYSRDEHKQHGMRQRWSDTAPGSRITYVVGDVRDGPRLARATRGVDILVHAAALKRVEGSATHARELVKTNILGTANVVDAALDNGIAWTVALSSDKGCLPTNAYGKTKAVLEDLVLEGNALAGGHRPHAWQNDLGRTPEGPPRFACVRYGNVLDSTGSVLSLWRAAHAAGRPLPITDRQMTRFWITVEEAVRFVQLVVEKMQGGEIFLPRMRHSYVIDVAHALYGNTLRVQELGERPGGEKLHEDLVGIDEGRHTTSWVGGYIVEPQQPTWGPYERVGIPLGAAPVRSCDKPLETVESLRTWFEEVELHK